jgi:DNA ligase 1
VSSFAHFAEMCDALAATPAKLEKRAIIADYLHALPIDDAGRAALWLAGAPFAETDPRVLNIGGSLLSQAVAEISGAGSADLGAAYRRHGDFGAAAADLLWAAKPGRAALAPTLTLADVEDAFTALAEARGPAPKLRLLLTLLGRATPDETKYLIKLATGDMRTGVRQSLVEEAIAEAWAAPAAGVRRASMLLGSLPEVVSLATTGRLDQARMKLFHPLGFMLASPVASTSEAIARFTQEIAEELHAAAAPQNAALREAQLEDKYDGIRAQLHVSEGRVSIYSRNRDDLSASFPDLTEAFAAIGEAAILDGEILAWSPAAGRALPFSSLQQRLGRKRVTPEMRRDVPVLLVVFDILYRQDQLLLDEPLARRRAVLEDFCARWAPATAALEARGQATLFAAPDAAFPRLVLAPATRLTNAEDLDRAWLEARARGNEGVMIKSLASLYQPGRRGLAWLKLKRELATLDVVVTGVEFGNGRRAHVLSDYTFAVRDTHDQDAPLKNVGKAYSGLTDQEIADMTAYFKVHTLEDRGHFRTVEPTVVLEVAFNNVMRSTRHASGFALRFPRIVRIRTDKPAAEVDTLRRVEEIYNSQPDKPDDEAEP